MKNFLDQFYTIDEKTRNYIIEIALQDYDEIFNTWDSAVYNIRDLDSSLKTFLEDCFYDIANEHGVTLRFNMNDEVKDQKREKNIEQGIRNYFHYNLFLTRKEFTQKRKRALLYIVFSFLFTLVSFFVQYVDNDMFAYKFVSLSLTVGGWVFMWEAFSMLFINSSDLRRKRKQYERILESTVVFMYQ
ncbi:hypothetical protein E3U55_10565 [Filobacillus milosensis]|uniref:Uncharacterized protein n=1 Tax=Filobacillus milosensis TaxID=94137 RepID=A0A4Y8IG08_9BACI|nr:hypothetical protein [Filobacillus milosensis]TFB19593.1 hypothetical protein E3U55_10565 [Filobacillus milosensis]